MTPVTDAMVNPAGNFVVETVKDVADPNGVINGERLVMAAPLVYVNALFPYAIAIWFTAIEMGEEVVLPPLFVAITTIAEDAETVALVPVIEPSEFIVKLPGNVPEFNAYDTAFPPLFVGFAIDAAMPT